MLNFKKYVASMATLSTVLLISSSAWAMEVAFASSQTTLYWNSFSGLNDFTWFGKSTNAESRVASAWVMDGNVLKEAPASIPADTGWVNINHTSSYSSYPDINASGVVAGDMLTASAVTEVIYPGNIYTADAASWRNGVFSVSATSTYTFSIDYSFSQSLAISGSPGSYADALSYIYCTLHEWNGTSWDLVESPLIDYRNSLVGDVEVPYTSSVYDTGIQTFSFEHELESGKYYNFTGGGYTYSGAETPVPIPGAVWLLGSGLLGMIATRRKSAQ
ncbi:MAG: VPLPA-CTERM sorting domain-containing protein [Proteobacteria bacterium]|nr:VPLPA-CTERM sorting domain-containing protein [Pseudomonadota bacterium]MBU4297233.1 VPLPA-CTERM sorting domain-containing protein [Pseudomonadota bacterium]MCG2748541.1 VPLPA-CTERM sorting domain-containing protein [Desulfobulbaceae bacterium]